MISSMGKRYSRGFTFIEMMVTLGLVVLMLGISLFAMKRGDSKVSTVGLAAAVADEMRAARMLAISSGHPVALGIPTNNGSTPVANSLYRLEGWNVPRVTWSVGYGGDYPDLGFAACRWSPASGTFTNGAAAPLLSKVTGFDLNSWAPTDNQSDSLFCFTPDGGLITNNLPALDGRYTIVIAKNPSISGTTITAGEEAAVVYVSPGGAVDYSKGTPGATLSGGAQAPRAPVQERDDPPTGTASIQMSEITVRPNANDPSGTNDAYCIPGQQITFELYAYDPEGRDLFCQWEQDTSESGGREGNFTVPRSTSGPLVSETERMEWVNNPPQGLNWLGSEGAPNGGCFRARWTWTVPVTSVFGDTYLVQADVKDAKGDAQIENRPPPMRLPGAPTGRLLVEILVNGRWQMLRMNPDGSGQQLLTPQGVEEIMPSASHDGTKVAFIQGPPGQQNQRYIKVRSLTGGGEFVVDGPGYYTSVSLSPDGGWISYRDNASGQLIFRRLGDPLPPVAFTRAQAWGGSVVAEPKSRTGWSADGNYAVWGNDSSLIATNLNTESDNPFFSYTVNSLGNPERMFAPTCFTPPTGGGERVVFTIGNINPVLGHIGFNPTGSSSGSFNDGTIALVDLNGGGGGAGSGSFDDGLPNVSVDGGSLVLPRFDRSTNTQSALVAPWTGSTFVSNPSNPQSINQNIRSAVWLP